MSIIGRVGEVSTLPVRDTARPGNITVGEAHWGDWSAGSRESDALVLTLSNLEPGATLLFVNADDPKVREFAATGCWDKLPQCEVKEYPLPARDLAGDQVLSFSKKLAGELGLTTGCEFMVTQRDRAGNVSDKPARFDVRPANITVREACWGELKRGSNPNDPLMLAVSGLHPGATLLFVNTDDPKIKRLAKTGCWDKLPPGAVQEYPLPNTDLSSDQLLTFTDGLAEKLGLTVGCEFMVTQRDCAGNVSKRPAHVKLDSGDGGTRCNYRIPTGTQIGNVDAFDRANPYYLTKAQDKTPSTVYANDIKLSLDASSRKVVLSGDLAVTGESTVAFKNLATQWKGSVQAGEEGSFSTEVGLKPGDPYSLGVTDRNGVYQDIVSVAYFEPHCDEKKDAGESQAPSASA